MTEFTTSYRTLLAVVLAVVVVSGTDLWRPAGVVRYEAGDVAINEADDRGIVHNCGSVPFTAYWTPKVLTGYKPLYITIKYTLPHKVSFFNATTTVATWKNGKEKVLIYSKKSYRCNKKISVPLNTTCPLQSGYKINLKFLFPFYRVFIGFQGKYSLRMEATNQDGHELFCLFANATVKND